MVKNYWIKQALLFVTAFLLTLTTIVVADSYSDFFIQVTDAQTALKNGEEERVKQILSDLKMSFESLSEADSAGGRAVQKTVDSLLAKQQLSSEDLVGLSKKLLAFEEEQNPVDVEAEKEKFRKKIYPALENLKEVISGEDVEAMKTEYLAYNAVWTRNEAIVRSSEGGHYGKIETAMSFLRASIEAEPFDSELVLSNLEDLEVSIEHFLLGKSVKTTRDIRTLSQGIAVLEEAYEAFVAEDTALGQEKMKTFISNWTVFEGEVSTRNASLYNKVESQTPLIMAKGNEEVYQEKLATLIAELYEVDRSGAYHFVDAMLILLREGVEALLIVLALVEMLKAGKQKKGLKWVYAGAFVGIIASIGVAVALQLLFPALAAGTNREILEGLVGLFAVVMMLGVGIWLHSKSNTRAWKSYMEKQMTLVLSTGSFISMFAISFLAVFREGAETILFYAGMLPNIDIKEFILGIALAILVLLVLTVVLTKTSRKIPVHLFFGLLTVMIYVLAFKMLGVSIHALQLTNLLPNHLLPAIPSVDLLGIYPSLEPLGAQLIFLVIVLSVSLWQRRKGRSHD